jgi:preprotein translocase subunit Sss1
MGLDREERETIQHISDTLDEVLVVLKKPDNKFMKVLEVAGAVVSVLAILGIVDVIRTWVFGG